jgi:hypothetical protein
MSWPVRVSWSESFASIKALESPDHAHVFGSKVATVLWVGDCAASIHPEFTASTRASRSRW